MHARDLCSAVAVGQCAQCLVDSERHPVPHCGYFVRQRWRRPQPHLGGEVAAERTRIALVARHEVLSFVCLGEPRAISARPPTIKYTAPCNTAHGPRPLHGYTRISESETARRCRQSCEQEKRGCGHGPLLSRGTAPESFGIPDAGGKRQHQAKTSCGRSSLSWGDHLPADGRVDHSRVAEQSEDRVPAAVLERLPNVGQ